MTEMNPEQTGVDVHPDGAYVESDEHVPDPTAVTGTLDTSGTAGAADSRIENTTPVFEAAKAQDLQYAALAVDPEHPEVPESAVVLPDDHLTPDQARDNVRQAAEAYQEDPVQVQDPTIQQAQRNAESGASTDPARVEADQKGAAPMGDLHTGDRSAENPTGA
jgi:hypothetical protein